MNKAESYINSNRDFYIDFLRFIALSLIILVHVNCPDWLKQLRCFDVPLIVFVSGLSCTYSDKSKVGDWLWKRTKRLIIPTYIFFSVYMLLLYVFSENDLITLDKVIGTYFMLNSPSVGYVYIIRVFLLVMICTPLFLISNNNHQCVILLKCDGVCVGGGKYLIISLLLFVFLEFSVLFVHFSDNGFVGVLYNQYFIYAMAYSIPFLIGYSLKTLRRERVRLTILIAIAVLVIGAIIYYLFNGLPFVITPTFKYPPHAYYIIYGCCISVLLYCIRYVEPVQKIVNKMKWAIFVGQNTIWIYFWHILFLLIVDRITSYWLLKYIVVYTLSVFAFLLQYKIVKKLNYKFLNKYFIG